MDELKEIIHELREAIQKLWCEAGELEAFLGKAANRISEAGYRKIKGTPPLLSDSEIEILWRSMFIIHGFTGIYEAFRVVAQAQHDADVRFYDKQIVNKENKENL